MKRPSKLSRLLGNYSAFDDPRELRAEFNEMDLHSRTQATKPIPILLSTPAASQLSRQGTFSKGESAPKSLAQIIVEWFGWLIIYAAAVTIIFVVFGWALR